MARHHLSAAFSHVLRRLFHDAPNRHAPRVLGRKASSRRRERPYLEALEDRVTPTTFALTTFADDSTPNSLRGAITQANHDLGPTTDIIQLAAGTYPLTIANSGGKHETSNAQGDLNFGSNGHGLIIRGTTDAQGHPTTTIRQTVLDRVFQVLGTGLKVTFKDLIIEGGQAQDDGADQAAAGSTEAEGGGILDDGGDITLTNVLLRQNSAVAGAGFGGEGGGIFAGQEGSLTIRSSVVQGNDAVGGAIGNLGGEALGGGIFAICPTAITNSTLSDNAVLGGNADNNKAGGFGGEASGGGVCALGPTTITHSFLLNNTAAGGAGDTFVGGGAGGGGIFTRGTTTITASTLSDNTLIGGRSSAGIGGSAIGGGVCAEGTTTITTSTLSGNTLIGNTSNVSSNFNVFGDGGGSAEGGGIFVSTLGTATISASTLSDNILIGGDGSINNSNVFISGNVGGHAQGGGVYAQIYSKVTIRSSTLSANRLTGGNGTFVSGTVQCRIGGSASGGGVYANDAAVTITTSTLSGNTVSGGSAHRGRGGIATPGTAQGGGASFVGGADNKLVNSTIADNRAVGGPSASVASVASAAAGGGLFFTNKAAATLTNVTVAGNKASLPRGTRGNTVGGGIDNDSGAVTLVNTLVARNSAATGPDYAGAARAGSSHNLIGDATGSTGFSAAHGDLLGTTTNPLDPHLGPLQNNGRLTPTLALLPGSPALNAGSNSAQSVTGPFDQRGQGFARVASGTIDIGAFEFEPPPSSPPSPPSPGGSSPTPKPTTLHTPALLHGIEAVNGNDTETVTDSLFGTPLLVSIYDGRGDLTSVTLFGINVTSLFELPL
jgi:hypothetical protein